MPALRKQRIPTAAKRQLIPDVPPVAPPNSAEQRLAMVSEAAYYRAEKRNFESGHELEDWLAAEHEIDALPSRMDTAPGG